MEFSVRVCHFSCQAKWAKCSVPLLMELSKWTHGHFFPRPAEWFGLWWHWISLSLSFGGCAGVLSSLVPDVGGYTSLQVTFLIRNWLRITVDFTVCADQAPAHHPPPSHPIWWLNQCYWDRDLPLWASDQPSIHCQFTQIWSSQMASESGLTSDDTKHSSNMFDSNVNVLKAMFA